MTFGDIKAELGKGYSIIPDSMEISDYKNHVLKRIEFHEQKGTSLSKKVLEVLKSDLNTIKKIKENDEKR